MGLIERLAYVGLSLAFLVAVFVPLERAFPARSGQAFLRPRFSTDLLFLLGQYLLWNGLVLGVLSLLRTRLDVWIPVAAREAVRMQPFWLQAVEVVVLSDVSVYWAHRIQHRVPLLWRFHAIHHGAEHLDWLAAHREHPLDSIYTLTFINLPPLLLGFPVSALAALVAFRGIWAIYIHSNVRLPLGPVRAVVGSPELHHWHHDRNRFAGNYANISPLMDVLFGTYRCPDREPEAFGLREPLGKGYVGQLVHPFLPTRPRMPGKSRGTGATTPSRSPAPRGRRGGVRSSA